MPAKKTPVKASRATKEAGSLERYHAKRDFKATPEPRGARAKKSPRLRFVIQKHRATRLHYDFRLEADGVLKSWAIPKGPSLNPKDRRLAMHVEDHPFDYRTFEGIIPEGNYGAGEVIVWDEGTYRLTEGEDPATEIGRGKIKFILDGKKLHGEFTLVRIRGRGDESGDPWLLIKDHDAYVDTSYAIEKDDTSAKTGKTLAQIAADPRAPYWLSDKKKAETKPSRLRAAAKRVKHDSVPVIATPMLATLVDEPFDDPDWVFEIKWDGNRAMCTIDAGGRVHLVSRNGLDLLPRFSELEGLASAFASVPIIVDGEIVSLDARGRSSFQRLQEKSSPIFVAFDVLYVDGKDVRKLPLIERKALLERQITDESLVLYSKHVRERGCALYAQAQKQQLEGIIGKRLDSPYIERRSRDWVKIKAQLVQECVVGGFTEPRGGRKGFGSLLLGLYDRGKLWYVGHAGTGFTMKKLAEITKQLKSIEQTVSPFANKVLANARPHWTKPQLVAQIRFTEWTREGYMRHPAFLGLRDDKPPLECVRERAADADDVA